MRALKVVSASVFLLAVSATAVAAESSATTHTEIYINNNGHEKSYVSDQPGTVIMESDDGSSTVRVENNVGGVTSTPRPSVTQKPVKSNLTSTPIPSNTPTKKKEVLGTQTTSVTQQHVSGFEIFLQLLRKWLHINS
jgi:hypothetical protein